MPKKPHLEVVATAVKLQHTPTTMAAKGNNSSENQTI